MMEGRLVDASAGGRLLFWGVRICVPHIECCWRVGRTSAALRLTVRSPAALKRVRFCRSAHLPTSQRKRVWRRIPSARIPHIGPQRRCRGELVTRPFRTRRPSRARRCVASKCGPTDVCVSGLGVSGVAKGGSRCSPPREWRKPRVICGTSHRSQASWSGQGCIRVCVCVCRVSLLAQYMGMHWVGEVSQGSPPQFRRARRRDRHTPSASVGSPRVAAPMPQLIFLCVVVRAGFEACSQHAAGMGHCAKWHHPKDV